MIMNNRILELLKEAGFVFWKTESWGPGPNIIDWSSNYDKEIREKFEIKQDREAWQKYNFPEIKNDNE